MTHLLERYLIENNPKKFLQECKNTQNDALAKIFIFLNKNDEKLASFYKDATQKSHDTTITNFIKVKLFCNWTTTEKLSQQWNKMSKGMFTWNNIKLVWKSEDIPDFYIVINKPLPEDEKHIVPNKTIVCQMEPHMEKNPQQWGSWSNPSDEKFLKILSHFNSYNNIEWHINKTYSELLSFHPTKTENVISTILSDKYKDPGHIKRVDFVKFLDSKNLQVDVFGNNKWNYKNYKGSLPYHAKDSGLFPYKYTFNVENNSIRNYCTEKVIDAILSDCLIFYSGCYNLKEYIDEKAFVYLELNDFEHDYNIVKNAIENNLWEKRLPYIRKEKKRILEYYQFFPRIERILNNIDVGK